MAPFPNSACPPLVCRTVRAAAVGALLLAAGSASAQPFRSNVPGGSFDTAQALTYWTGYDFEYAASWSFVDLEDSPTSGSLLSEHYDHQPIDFTARSACRSAVPEREYHFGAWQLTPAGQPSSGIVRVELHWYANCQTSISLENPAVVTSSTGKTKKRANESR